MGDEWRSVECRPILLMVQLEGSRWVRWDGTEAPPDPNVNLMSYDNIEESECVLRWWWWWQMPFFLPDLRDSILLWTQLKVTKIVEPLASPPAKIAVMQALGPSLLVGCRAPSILPKWDEFETQPVEALDFRKFIHHCRGICGIYLHLVTKNRKMSTLSPVGFGNTGISTGYAPK